MTTPAHDPSDPRPSAWARFRLWWRGTKPTDAIGALFAAGSAVIAIWALVQANETAERQSRLEREQSAPVLAPETPPEVRGKRITVHTQYRKIRKRADRVLVRRDPDGRGHVIIPMRNGGAGIALTVGLPVVVEDCLQQPDALPPSAAGLLGTYALPSGASDQLAYFQPRGRRRHAPRYESGSVEVDGKRRSYGWNYARYSRTDQQGKLNLLLWYTDGARRKLRWTCTTYNRQERSSRKDGYQYAVEQQIYGSKDFPPEIDTIAP
jgi:hypothetical protein